MIEQVAIVAIVVTGCTAYAAWTLMPASARRVVAQALLRLPLPQRQAARLRKHLVAASGCGCDGCDHATKKKPAPAAAQPIRFRPRVKR